MLLYHPPGPALRRSLAVLLLLLLIVPMAVVFSTSAQPKYTPQRLAEHHGMGLILPSMHLRTAAPDVVPSGLPASVDLSQYLPPVGDQGQVGSCASWAAGYSLRGWYAEKYGNYPVGGFAPMSLYSRLVKKYDNGLDNGSSLSQVFGEMNTAGIARSSIYTQGNYDYTDLPTAAEAADALTWKSSGSRELYQATVVGVDTSPQAIIMAELATGNPVVIGFLVYPEYESYGLFSTSGAVPAPTSGEAVLGGHANIAYGYNDKGLLVRNQWGLGWGNQGNGILSWAYVNATVEEVASMAVPVPPAPQPTPSPQPAPVGPNLVAWPNPQPAQLPAALPAGVYKEEIIVTDSLGRVRAMAVVKAQRNTH